MVFGSVKEERLETARGWRAGVGVGKANCWREGENFLKIKKRIRAVIKIKGNSFFITNIIF